MHRGICHQKGGVLCHPGHNATKGMAWQLARCVLGPSQNESPAAHVRARTRLLQRLLHLWQGEAAAAVAVKGEEAVLHVDQEAVQACKLLQPQLARLVRVKGPAHGPRGQGWQGQGEEGEGEERRGRERGCSPAKRAGASSLRAAACTGGGEAIVMRARQQRVAAACIHADCALWRRQIVLREVFAWRCSGKGVRGRRAVGERQRRAGASRQRCRRLSSFLGSMHAAPAALAGI